MCSVAFYENQPNRRDSITVFCHGIKEIYHFDLLLLNSIQVNGPIFLCTFHSCRYYPNIESSSLIYQQIYIQSFFTRLNLFTLALFNLDKGVLIWTIKYVHVVNIHFLRELIKFSVCVCSLYQTESV